MRKIEKQKDRKTEGQKDKKIERQRGKKTLKTERLMEKINLKLSNYIFAPTCVIIN
jgi:hypothetical protein